MNTDLFFTDTVQADLQYAGDGAVDAVTDVSAADLDTVKLDSPWNDFFDAKEFVQFEATVAQPLVQPYVYNGKLQRFQKTADELKAAQAQIENLPWTMGHPPDDRVTHADQIRGFWTDPVYDDGQHATLQIPATDTEAVRYALNNDEVSIGFSGSLDWDVADDNVDATQRNMAYDHIASVKDGRCPPEQGCELHIDDEVHDMSDSSEGANPTRCGLHTDDAPAIHGHVIDGVQTKMTEEDNMHSDMNPKYAEGDWVRWDWSGGSARGRVKNVSTDRPLSTSGTTRDPTEEGEPVYKARHWDEDEWGNDKVVYESNLESADQPSNFGDSHSESPQSRLHEADKFTDAYHHKQLEDAPVDDLYKSKETARSQAKKIGCGGVHEHVVNGTTMYMPCSSMDVFNSRTDSEHEYTDTLSPLTCSAVCSTGSCTCGLHDPFNDISVNGEEIDLVPPEAAQNAAQDALNARDDDDVTVNGMTDHGWERAEQLASGDELSPSDIVGSSGAMAPWWSRHAQYSITGGEQLSLTGSDANNPWEDNSYTAGKGWGGVAGYKWAIRKGNEIKRARDEEPTYDIADSLFESITVADDSIMETISYDGLMGGDLDESEIPNDDYENHYVFDADTKSDSSYPLVDADGNLRRGNVGAAWEVYGSAPNELKLLNVLAQANNQFANTDGFTAPISSDSLEETITEHTDTMTDSLEDFIDENDLTFDDVVDALDIDLQAIDSVPNEPTEFYDGEPDVEQLADDFDTVDLLVDEKESLEAEVDSLQSELRESRRPVFADKAEELASMTEKWGDEDDLLDKFDAEDDNERWDVETITDKIELVKDIKGSETTTVNDNANDADDDVETDYDATMTVADEDKIRTTDSGRLDLSQVRQ